MTPPLQRLGQVHLVCFSICLLVGFGNLVGVSVADELVTDESQKAATFERVIRPILVEHCFECHSAEASDGGLSLEFADTTRLGGETGRAVLPGDPDRSLLIQAIRYDAERLQMPPQGKLSESKIRALESWVAEGAYDPRPNQGETPRPVVGMDVAEGRRFWAFQPVSSPNPPALNRYEDANSSPQNPIDQFIIAGLVAQGLQISPAADRATLIRRLTYDLLGLPPSAEEIDQFVNDKSPTAYVKLVDRLLESPDYGIRWGRHWLDVARYADSNGLDENVAHGNAWRYRDYVVDAFNQDIPVDQFITEQVAGDLLPRADLTTRTATGFLAMGAKVLAERDRDKLDADVIDEQLDSLGKAFLGMTFGCARCHDHKFDPITQEDYYSLAAIFKGTQTLVNVSGSYRWYEHSFATVDETQKIKLVDDEVAKRKAAAEQYLKQAANALREQVRHHALDYLLAAVRCSPDMSLVEFEQIAATKHLHPRVLQHCRKHIHFNQQDPFFDCWRQNAATGDLRAIESHYQPLFQQASSNAPDGTVAPADWQMAKDRLADPSGFLAIPSQPQHALDEKTLATYHNLTEEARLYESQAADVPSVMSVRDRQVAFEMPIHIRGNHLSLGRSVSRGFPAVMHDSVKNIQFVRHQSGRLQLAQWLTSSQNPLTARVYVNRVWAWHFGKGLVPSTENFGVLGDRPSHPELLDWLASEFVQSGWSTKHLHRLIVSSSTYQMSANGNDRTSEKAKTIDPTNRLLWRFPMKRLDIEQIRDSLLVAAGQLDRRMGGKTLKLRNYQYVFDHTSVDHTRYDSHLRSIYLPVIRNHLFPWFEQFDFPDPSTPSGSRASTMVAPQSLMLMNSDFVWRLCQQLSERVIGRYRVSSDRVSAIYRSVLGREPDADERMRAITFVECVDSAVINHAFVETPTRANQNDMTKRYAMLCQCLMACNEFFYVR